jgi:rfaE bifunctional protein nucleotidyltransferase chain/domain
LVVLAYSKTMNGKILTTQEAVKVAEKTRAENKKIVLAGGCFDILHVGHITYLEGAKKKGDVLFVLLESDEKIKKVKGEKRPINSQKDRAAVLQALSPVDYIIPINNLKGDSDYDKLVSSLKPAIIAITKGDSARSHKERQGGLTGAKVVEVADPIVNQSTTRLIEILNEI